MQAESSRETSQPPYPDWYLYPRDFGDAPKWIGDSFGLDTHQGGQSVKAVHPLSPDPAIHVETWKGMGQMQHTITGRSRIPFLLVRRTHDGQPDTQVKVGITGRLYAGVITVTKPGEEGELMRMGPDGKSGSFNEELWGLLKGGTSFTPLYSHNCLQLTRSGESIKPFGVMGQQSVQEGSGPIYQMSVNLQGLEQLHWNKNKSYATSASEVIKNVKNLKLYGPTEILGTQNGFVYRGWVDDSARVHLSDREGHIQAAGRAPEALQMAMDQAPRPTLDLSDRPQMSSTIETPLELDFDHLGLANEPSPSVVHSRQPYTKVGLVCQLQTRMEMDGGKEEWYLSMYVPTEQNAIGNNAEIKPDYTTETSVTLHNVRQEAHRTDHEISWQRPFQAGELLRIDDTSVTRIPIEIKDTLTFKHSSDHSIGGDAIVKVRGSHTIERCPCCHNSKNPSVFDHVIQGATGEETETAGQFKDRLFETRYRIDPDTVMVKVEGPSELNSTGRISLAELSRKRERAGHEKTASGIVGESTHIVLPGLSHSSKTNLEIMFPDSTDSGISKLLGRGAPLFLSGLTLANREREWQEAGALTLTHKLEMRSIPSLTRNNPENTKTTGKRPRPERFSRRGASRADQNDEL